jgi:predicted nucleotidyltransferase
LPRRSPLFAFDRGGTCSLARARAGPTALGLHEREKLACISGSPTSVAARLGNLMIDRQTILDRIAAHAAELHSLGARSVALFGSFARGEAGERSDVDLLVDLDEHTFDRYMDLKLRLEDLLGRSVDLVLIDGLKPRVKNKILSEAIRAA